MGERGETEVEKQRRVKRAQAFVADCMDDILSQFRPGAKITVLIRRPGDPDQDFCMTSDDLAEVAAMIQRRKDAGYD